MLRRLALVLPLLVCLAAPGLAAAPNDRLEISLRLYVALWALWTGDTQPLDGPTLMLDLEREDGRWGRVWGMARDFNVSTHLGRVTKSTITDTQVALTVEMLIAGDSWVPGGRAKYDVTATRDARGNLTGTYAGVFAGKPVKGKVEGEVKPQRGELMPPGYVPAKAGEHPRILFRKWQLPELRKRAETPFGQACLARMAGPVGLGMRYQLFGDAQAAATAYEQVIGLVNQGWHSDQYGNNIGDRLEKAAITYDLCYDAWTAGQRKKVEHYLVYGSHGIMYEQRACGAGINWHVCSNWSAPLFAGLGFAGLALWGERGPEPGKPVSPSEAESIAPAIDYEPGKGVPVVPLEIGKSPSQWLTLPFIDYVVDSDPLQGIGGLERARPEVGTTVEIDDAEYAFRLLEPKFVLPGGGIDLSKFQPKASATMVFYTVLRNDRPRTVKISMPATRSGRPVVVLNGNVLHDGRVVEIQEGLYPLVVAGRWMIKWSTLIPRIEEATVEDMERNRDILAVRQAEYREAYRDWQDDYAEWKRLGEADQRYLKLFHTGRRMMYFHNREASGTGGMQAEVSHYGNIATAPPARYAASYRMMFGEDVSPYADIIQVVPRKMFTHVYGDGWSRAQDINGHPNIPLDFYASMYPIVQEAYKPAVLWAWNRDAGVTGPELEKSKLAQGDAVRTFITYPLDGEAKSPKGILPLTWEAPDFGFYGWRNAWDGGDDIVFQAFGKSHVIGGWNGPNGGTFRLQGLGHVWAHGTTDRNRCRWEESVVQLPDDEDRINQGAQARLLAWKPEADGSGVLSWDMHDIYSGFFLGGRGDRVRQYDRYGNGRHPLAFKDLGIAGVRSLAADFSGLSGAPGLFVIVDKITGGGSKVWTWQLGNVDPKDKTAVPTKATVDGLRFTIAKGDATCVGTFVPTSDALKVTAEVRAKQMVGGGGSSRGKTLPRPINGVFAEGADSFFCIVTLQKGPAPEMTIDGAGLDAVVTVGQRTVRFDGEKVVFGVVGT